jgi:lipoprotein-anchoring transpeptidase ErfK/SrfK
VGLAASTLVIIGSLLASQVHAKEISTQPLTRADCVRAGMTWNDTANVCAAAQGLEAFVEALFAQRGMSEVAGNQPLTRHDCDSGGMTWNDAANVCGVAAQAAEQMSEPQDAQPQDAQPMPTPEVADTVGQPLTKHDCDSVGIAWNDTANVCGEAAQAAEAMPEVQLVQPMLKSEMADTPGQPLTREDCDQAGIAWNDTANVCGAAPQAAEGQPETQESITQTALEDTTAITSTVLINIDKASQKMTVLLDDVQQYEWPVSTGLRGYTTPSGTYTARSMNKIWYSRQWDNAPMPHAVFFTRDGHAIHGTYEVKRLGKPASHGCVRLSPENAALLYALVEKTGLENTQVVLVGNTPGGEGNVANKTRTKSSYRRASRSQYKNYYADSFAERPRRGRVFRRLFGGL